MFDRRTELKGKLTKVLDDEELIWKARANLRWLKEGDGNTKFFHAHANGRRRANTIGTIEDDGRRYSREEDKKSYFVHKFKDLFSPSDVGPSAFGDWSALFRQRRLSSSDRESLSAPFSLEEIRAVVFKLGGDKAPGPDGFPLCFYQAFWETVKDDIWKIFLKLFDGSISTGPIDYSFICLVPKKEGARRATDFRPISLLNGIQKNHLQSPRQQIGAGPTNLDLPVSIRFPQGAEHF